LNTLRTVYTISQLNNAVRLLLSEHFGTIWVEGEISNLAQPSSGHFYFTLKDAEAQVRCALFRGSARFLTFRPANGMKVVARAQVGLYEPRGDYQLTVDYLEEAGEGALRRAFEVLKAKLAAEGLFDAARKKPIPVPPRCLGIITSPTGAAVRDVLTILKRRFPALPVIIFPVKVQGNEAKYEIVRALQQAERLGLCDALLLVRGGGSLEDLWTFNEEIVARAIAACPLPIVSGVGHETDVTIADWVADLRAPTPSAAAEAISPDSAEWLTQLQRLAARLQQQIDLPLSRQVQRVAFLDKRLQQQHPEKVLQRHAQRLDEHEARLKRALHLTLTGKTARLATVTAKLHSQHPSRRIGFWQARQIELQRRLTHAITRLLETQQQTLHKNSGKLHTLSPLATLERGYAIAHDLDGKILRHSQDIAIGDLLEIRLADGGVLTKVHEKR
jgi:exodeoxyribonuclease VII large subunit